VKSLSDLTADDVRRLPAGAELDQLVAEAIGVEPDIVWIASNDGGKSACADVDPRHGPWYTKRQLADWLKERHSRGTHGGYELLAWKRYRSYSTDAVAACAACAAAQKLGGGWLWSLDWEGDGYRFTWLLPEPDGCTGHPFGPSAEAKTEDLARCRAVLLAWLAVACKEAPK